MLLIVHGGSETVNRAALENPRVDVLNHPAFDKSSGLNQVLAKAAAENGVATTSEFAYNLDEAWEIAKKIGFPLIIRPSFTLGGTGGGIVYAESDFAPRGPVRAPLPPASTRSSSRSR